MLKLRGVPHDNPVSPRKKSCMLPKMSDQPIVRASAEIPVETIGAGKGASRQVLLGPTESMPNFFLRKFAMEPGGGMPCHTNEVEHEQYVLAGSAEIRIGDRLHEVKAGDTVYIPARVPHSYRVTGGERFEFLCIVPNLPDETKFVG